MSQPELGKVIFRYYNSQMGRAVPAGGIVGVTVSKRCHVTHVIFLLHYLVKLIIKVASKAEVKLFSLNYITNVTVTPYLLQ